MSNQRQLFHIYIGTVYQGPIKAKDADHACVLYAKSTRKSRHIYHAMPAASVQQLKVAKPKDKHETFVGTPNQVRQQQAAA